MINECFDEKIVESISEVSRKTANTEIKRCRDLNIKYVTVIKIISK